MHRNITQSECFNFNKGRDFIQFLFFNRDFLYIAMPIALFLSWNFKKMTQKNPNKTNKPKRTFELLEYFDRFEKKTWYKNISILQLVGRKKHSKVRLWTMGHTRDWTDGEVADLIGEHCVVVGEAKLLHKHEDSKLSCSLGANSTSNGWGGVTRHCRRYTPDLTL